MKTFWAWAYVFCFFSIIFDQSLETAAGKKIVFASKNVGPPKTKFLATSLSTTG